MKIAIGSDHAGFELKNYLQIELKKLGFDMINCGVDDCVSSDYPDYAKKICDKVINKEAVLGIAVCGTGVGISIAANKIRGIRAALCDTEYTAKMSRLHNDANVLALGGRVIGKGLALEIAKVFLNTAFSNEERHQRRINKTMNLEDEKK